MFAFSVLDDRGDSWGLGHEGMGLGGAAKDTKEREEVVHIACSICLEAVKSGGDRSTARLQCGHEFHLGRLFYSIPDGLIFPFWFLLIGPEICAN